MEIPKGILKPTIKKLLLTFATTLFLSIISFLLGTRSLISAIAAFLYPFILLSFSAFIGLRYKNLSLALAIFIFLFAFRLITLLNPIISCKVS